MAADSNFEGQRPAAGSSSWFASFASQQQQQGGSSSSQSSWFFGNRKTEEDGTNSRTPGDSGTPESSDREQLYNGELPKKAPENLADETLESMNHYEILMIHFGANKSEVVKAYRDQARQWHPDKQHPQDREVCTRRFKRIQAAHQCLTDPKLRALYDEYLRVCSSYSSSGGFEGTFAEFQNYAKTVMFPGGRTSYEEAVYQRAGVSDQATEEDKFWTDVEHNTSGGAGQDGSFRDFAPSSDDIKWLCLSSGGLLLGSYLVYKFFFAEKMWLRDVPFLTSLEWVEISLPGSFEVAMVQVERKLRAVSHWSRVLGSGSRSSKVGTKKYY